MNFKKTTLALALAGAMTTPLAFADVKLGGKLQINLEQTEVGDTKNSWLLESYDVEIDVTAVEQAGSVKYIGDIDLDFADTDGNFDLESARFIAVGDFGVFVMGDQSPSGLDADIYDGADVMYEYSQFYTAQTDETGAFLLYKTPNFGPVYGVIATYHLGGEDTDTNVNGVSTKKDIDLVAGRIVYKANGLTAGVAFVDFEGKDRSDRTSFGVSYAADKFSVGLVYEKRDEADDVGAWDLNSDGSVDAADMVLIDTNGEINSAVGIGDVDIWNIGATYDVNDALTLKLAYGMLEFDNDFVEYETTSTALGLEYALSKNVAFYVETYSEDDDLDLAEEKGTVIGTSVTF